MKICCIADLHIGIKSYSQIDPETHFYTRELEVLNNFKKIIDICINDNIPILIIAGDIYHNFKPSPNLQDEVNKLLFYASQNNIYLLILDGNHDLSKQEGSVSVLESADTFKVRNIIHTSKFLDKELNINNEIIRFIFLPTYTTNEEIKSLLDQNLYKNNEYKNSIIVIGHFTTQNAQLNDWLIAENEEYIDLYNFSDRNISFVVLGHLHKPQILSKNPIIFYTGSLQRSDFNEENQDKGYWIINTADNTYKFFKIDTQKFYTLDVKIEDENALERIKEKIDKEKVKDAIVRVIIEIEEQYKLTEDEEAQLKEYLINLRASNILAFKQRIINNKKVRNIEFNELLSIDKALEIFYKDQPRAKERIQLGKEIYNQYKNLM